MALRDLAGSFQHFAIVKSAWVTTLVEVYIQICSSRWRNGITILRHPETMAQAKSFQRLWRPYRTWLSCMPCCKQSKAAPIRSAGRSDISWCCGMLCPVWEPCRLAEFLAIACQGWYGWSMLIYWWVDASGECVKIEQWWLWHHWGRMGESHLQEPRRFQGLHTRVPPTGSYFPKRLSLRLRLSVIVRRHFCSMDRVPFWINDGPVALSGLAFGKHGRTFGSGMLGK